MNKENLTAVRPLGEQFERNFFANSAKSAKYRPRRLPHHTGMKRIIEKYEREGKTPTPPTFQSDLIFKKVKEFLPEESWKNLKLYDALGTSLDFHHGVDGFFLLENSFATFDLSLRRKRRIKADIVIGPDCLMFETEMRAAARRIASLLTSNSPRQRLDLKINSTTRP